MMMRRRTHPSVEEEEDTSEEAEQTEEGVSTCLPLLTATDLPVCQTESWFATCSGSILCLALNSVIGCHSLGCVSSPAQV